VYYGKPTLVSGFPLTDKPDLVLPIEGYTVTFDTNGGAFEDGGTTLTMTALENGTLTPPSEPQDERDFVGWYSAGKSFTAETRITGDTAVYARLVTEHRGHCGLPYKCARWRLPC
jgi:hypothetical protein